MIKAKEIIFQKLKVEDNQDCSFAAQIADQIHWLIVSKQIQPGDRLPSIRKLADHLNVNLHTVSAAYHRLEDNRLIATRQGLGSVVVEYQPADTIFNTSIPTHTFGVIVPDLGNPFYPAFLSGAAKVAQENHVHLMPSDTQEPHSLGKAHFDMRIAKRVDGMLIAPWGFRHDGEDEFFQGDFYDYPIPLVFVDQPHIRGHAVLLDAKNAGFLATEHLAQHGHDEIAMISGDLSVPTLNEVYQGYLSALDRAGLSPSPDLLIECRGFTYQEGCRAANQLIESGRLPTAIFAAGDLFAVGAMKALRDAQIRIPEDVAIVGYNNVDLANYTTPTLTSVSTPIHELGRKSARLLLDLVSGRPIPQKQMTLPSRLVVRQSCGCRDSHD